MDTGPLSMAEATGDFVAKPLRSFVEEIRLRRRAALRDAAIILMAHMVGAREAKRVVYAATDAQVAEFLIAVTRADEAAEAKPGDAGS